MTHPLPALGWCVHSGPTSTLVDAACWCINGCVMPLFFLLGGYLAAPIDRKHAGTAFIKHRSQRLLIPLALAVFFVLPADMYIWLAGWVTEGDIRMRKLLSIKLPEPLSSQFWGVAHLWYLECLWVISMAVWAGLHLAQKSGSSSRVINALREFDGSSLHPRSFRAAMGWAVVSGFILAAEPQILIGFQQRWFPSLAMIAFYTPFFIAGWTWPRHGNAAVSLSNFQAGAFGAAIVFAFLLPLIHQHVEAPRTGVALLGLSMAFSLFGWWMATSLFGIALAVRPCKVPSAVKFVAEASFWMYLVHHPVASLTQLALLKTSLGPETRFVISFGAAVWLSLASYAVLVRETWIGQLLNGRGSSVLQGNVAPAEIPELRRRAA